MKITADFITNSSSSVFLVAFPQRIKTLQYVKEFIFKEAHAKIIFKDAQEQDRKVKKISPDSKYILGKLTDELSSGYVEGIMRDFSATEKEFIREKGITLEDLRKNHRWSNVYFQQEQLQRQTRALNVAQTFAKENKGKYLYVFNYADDEGTIQAELEHGRVFHKLKHIRVSHH